MTRLLPGQVLVEMLVAIAVVTLALVAMVQLSTKSLSNAGFSEKQTAALNLATKAVECIRNNKNTKSWSDFYSDPKLGCQVGPTIYVTPNPGPPQKVTVVVTSTWTDNKGPHQSTQTTDFVNY